MQQSQLNAAVIGAGPAGCLAAIALHRAGVDVTIYERNRTPHVTGGGGPVFLGSLSQISCAILGIPYETVIGTGGRPCSGAITHFGHVSAELDWSMLTSAGLASRSCIRGEVAQAMRKRVEAEGILIVPGSKVVSYTEDSDGVTLHFDDEHARCDSNISKAPTGSPVRVDFIVAADGVNSAIRKRLLSPIDGEKVPFHYTLVGAFIRVPTEAEDTSLGADLLRDVATGHSVIAYQTPCSSGTTVIMTPHDGARVAFCCIMKDEGPSISHALEQAGIPVLKGAPPVAQKAFLSSILGEWAFEQHPEIRVAVDAMDTSVSAVHPPVTARLAAIPKPRIVSIGGRVLLIGDAGWPMHPANGLGLNLSFEAASTLYTLLSSRGPLLSNAAIPALLLEWAAARTPRIQTIMDQSIENFAAGRSDTWLRWKMMQWVAPCLLSRSVLPKLIWGMSYDGLPWVDVLKVLEELPAMVGEARAFRSGGVDALLGGARSRRMSTAAAAAANSSAGSAKGRPEEDEVER